MVDRLAVVDVETTGFGRLDRVVELSIVVVDSTTLEVVEEFDTLVNPMRDIGATGVHGVTASMVEAAPTFEDIVGPVAELVDGSVLVAHNLSFDQRFLMAEFARNGGHLIPGEGLCTLRLSGERLEVACSRFGIALDQHHRSLADARATLELLRILRSGVNGLPAQAVAPKHAAVRRTLRRDAVSSQPLTASGPRFFVPLPTSRGASISYLATLDAFLSDLILTRQERDSLTELAADFGINEVERAQLHRDYVASLVAAARRDGIITEQEHRIMQAVASALDVDTRLIPAVTNQPQPGTEWTGKRVCFTGSATFDGRTIGREELESLAAEHGMQPVSGVSKKGCDLLVAADASSTSGKAQKARGFGLPVISVQDFLEGLA